MRTPDGFYPNHVGIFVPSGTTVLKLLDKPALVKWAANCAVNYLRDERYFESMAPSNGVVSYVDILDKARTAYQRESMEAADYGTYIHTMCQYSLENNVELESPHEMTNDFMKGLWNWKTKYSVKVIAMEHEVVGDRYGGRLDIVCEMDGVVTLVDFKTGKGQYYKETWCPQLAGYRQLWNKLCRPEYHCNTGNAFIDKTIQRHGILKFNKKKTKTKGYSTNYKDFTEYEATRTCKSKPRKANGRLQTEKYTRTYEMDRKTFNTYVDSWWARERGE